MPMNYSKAFALMKEKGLTSYKIRKGKILGERTLQNMREGKSIETNALGKLCDVMECQPGDLCEWEYTDTSTKGAAQSGS